MGSLETEHNQSKHENAGLHTRKQGSSFTSSKNSFGKLQECEVFPKMEYLKDVDKQDQSLVHVQFQSERGRRRYCTFSSWTDLYQTVIDQEPEDRNWYEMQITNLYAKDRTRDTIEINQKRKMVFDIDMKCDEGDKTYMAVLSVLIEGIIRVFIALNIEIDLKNDILRFDASGIKTNRDTKYFVRSYHIVIDNYCFPSHLHTKYVYLEVLKHIPKEYHQWIDAGIYDTSRGMRMYLCSKKGDYRPKTLEGSWYHFGEEIICHLYNPLTRECNEKEVFHRSLLTQCIDCKLLVPTVKVSKTSKVSEKGSGQRRGKKSGNLPEELRKLLIAYDSTFESFTVRGSSTEDRYLLDSHKSYKCPLCSVNGTIVHDNDNVVVERRGKNFYYNCRSNMRGNKLQPLLLRNKDKANIVYNNEFVKRLRFREVRTVLVKSNTGTGKTFCAQQWIVKHKPRSVLLISCLITHAKTMKESYSNVTGKKFTLYLDKKGDLGDDYLVCNVNSLHRLTKFDYEFVVMDEIESIQNRFASKTMMCREKYSTGLECFDALSMLCKKSKYVYCADAFVQDRTFKTLRDLRGEFVYHRNDYKVKRFYDLALGRGVGDKLIKTTMELLRKGQKVLFTSTSVAVLDDLVLELTKAGVKYLRYDRDNRVQDPCIVEAWSDPDVRIVLYSPVITTGLDYNVKCKKNDCSSKNRKSKIPAHKGKCLPPFDTRVSYASKGSCNAFDVVQMMNRVRHFSSKHSYLGVSMYGGNRDIVHSRSTDQEQILKDLRKSGDFFVEYLGSRHINYDTPSIGVGALAHIVSSTIQINNECRYEPGMLTKVTNALRDTGEYQKKGFEKTEKSKKVKVKVENKNLNKIPTLDEEDYEDLCDLADEEGFKGYTQEQREQMAKYRFLQKFKKNTPQEVLDAHWSQWLDPHYRARIYKLSVLLEDIPIRALCERKADRATFQELCGVSFKRDILILELLEGLGIHPVRGGTLSVQDYEKNKNFVTEKIQELKTISPKTFATSRKQKNSEVRIPYPQDVLDVRYINYYSNLLCGLKCKRITKPKKLDGITKMILQCVYFGSINAAQYLEGF